jgi:hypothetical protein
MDGVCQPSHTTLTAEPDPLVMVAYNPRMPDDARPTLPPEIDAQLRAALLAHWNQSEGHDSLLESALAAAAQDAKSRGLRAEELLLALKRSEDLARRRLHACLLRGRSTVGALSGPTPRRFAV